MFEQLPGDLFLAEIGGDVESGHACDRGSGGEGVIWGAVLAVCWGVKW